MAYSKNIRDPIERIVAEALERADIAYIHEKQDIARTKNLDFLLLESGVFIECKAYPSERTAKQLEGKEAVILIQGRKAAELFAALVEGNEFH